MLDVVASDDHREVVQEAEPDEREGVEKTHCTTNPINFSENSTADCSYVSKGRLSLGAALQRLWAKKRR